MRQVILVISLCLGALLRPYPAFAQSAAEPAPASPLGPWVTTNDRAIDALRLRTMRVVVLDEQDRPVPGAQVQFQTLRREMPIGFVAPEHGWPEDVTVAPLWRGFSAVALQRQADWRQCQPRARFDPDFNALDQLVQDARQRGWAVRLGPLVSLAPEHRPNWLAQMPRDLAQQEARQWVAKVATRYAGQAGVIDLIADRPATQTLPPSDPFAGPDALRVLIDHLRASMPASPRPRLASFSRLALVDEPAAKRRAQRIDDRLSHLRLDHEAVSAHLSGLIVQRVFERQTHLLTAPHDPPLAIVGLQITGGSPAAAAINLETVLRTLLANPQVGAIYFDGLTPEDAFDPAAALLSEMGDPTEPGMALDRLLTTRCMTNTTQTTDELGNARVAAWPGSLRITVTLDDRHAAVLADLPAQSQQPERILPVRLPAASP